MKSPGVSTQLGSKPPGGGSERLRKMLLWTFKHSRFHLIKSHFILPLRSEVRRGSFFFHILICAATYFRAMLRANLYSESCCFFFVFYFKYCAFLRRSARAWAFITSRLLSVWAEVGKSSVLLQPLQWSFAWVCIELFYILKPLRGDRKSVV